MSAPPNPPVPAECTMSGNDWFPLHFARLRKSKWWRRATDTARARNVMMWGEAYSATPAGSLPDDDDELAEAAGYGMDVEAFLAVKNEIMAPWTLCSDGRWYHPTVCEVVLDAWARTSDRKKQDAERKRRQREKSRGVTPIFDDVTRDIHDVHCGEAENTRDIATQTEQTGQDTKDRQDPPNPPVGGEGLEGFAEGWEAYPIEGRATEGPSRAEGVWAAACHRAGGHERLIAAIRAYVASGYRGQHKLFHRWLSQDGFRAHLPKLAASSVGSWVGPDAIRAAFLATKDAEWVASYIDPSGWQDVPKALIARTSQAVDNIEAALRAMKAKRPEALIGLGVVLKARAA